MRGRPFRPLPASGEFRRPPSAGTCACGATGENSAAGQPVATTIAPAGPRAGRSGPPRSATARWVPPSGLSFLCRQGPVEVAGLVRPVTEGFPGGHSATTERVGPAAGWGRNLAAVLIAKRDAPLDDERAVVLDPDSCAGHGVPPAFDGGRYRAYPAPDDGSFRRRGARDTSEDCRSESHGKGRLQLPDGVDAPFPKRHGARPSGVAGNSVALTRRTAGRTVALSGPAGASDWHPPARPQYVVAVTGGLGRSSGSA